MNLDEPVEWADGPDDTRPDPAATEGPGGCAVMLMLAALVILAAGTGAAVALWLAP